MEKRADFPSLETEASEEHYLQVEHKALAFALYASAQFGFGGFPRQSKQKHDKICASLEKLHSYFPTESS
jgi:hypothetical protein